MNLKLHNKHSDNLPDCVKSIKISIKYKNDKYMDPIEVLKHSLPLIDADSDEEDDTDEMPDNLEELDEDLEEMLLDAVLEQICSQLEEKHNEINI